MVRIVPRALGLGLLLAVAAISAGCAFSAATILPSAVGTAPVVVDSFETGTSDTFWIAKYDDVVEAALRARVILSLQLKGEKIEDDKAVLRFADQLDERIILHIERRTDTVTRVRFVAGSREVRGLAGLLGRQIIDELRKANAFLVDWAAEEGADQL